GKQVINPSRCVTFASTRGGLFLPMRLSLICFALSHNAPEVRSSLFAHRVNPASTCGFVIASGTQHKFPIIATHETTMNEAHDTTRSRHGLWVSVHKRKHLVITFSLL
ncbi:MAG: hypothetical protein WBO55_09055, partial [Rhizobiaceae bacterium]